MKNITLAIEDQETFATANYHVVNGIYYNFNTLTVNCDIDSYAVKKAWEKKRRPLSRVGCELKFERENVPSYDDVITRLTTDDDSPLHGGAVDTVEGAEEINI